MRDAHACFRALFPISLRKRSLVFAMLEDQSGLGHHMKTKRTQIACVALIVLAASSVVMRQAHAAPFSDANWISMGGFPGANGSVNAAVVDTSGNLYIGGNFTAVGDGFASYIAKWDGTNWSALGGGLNDQVRALALSGGDLYAGGWFT
ncbi:MAG TPA: hypothetical protein VK850_11790, partial [Candidatus Binatia bacterium]|nr:hypothetical protein [Candidatus Binatia bacterium]